MVLETAEAIKTALADKPWLPQAFKEVLAGKNHLPRRKLRVGLLKRDSGFLGQGGYREHFFGSSRTPDLLMSFVSEQLRYSPLAVSRLKTRLKSDMSY